MGVNKSQRLSETDPPYLRPERSGDSTGTHQPRGYRRTGGMKVYSTFRHLNLGVSVDGQCQPQVL
jgi:hypothetical protein